MSTGDPQCGKCLQYFCFGTCNEIKYTKEFMSLRDKSVGRLEPFENVEGVAYEAGKARNKAALESYLTGYLGDDFFARKYADCIDLIRAKNSDYTEGKGAKDRIAHFRAAAKDLELPMMKIWQVFVRKHWSTIQKFANGGHLESEPIDGRIDDVINYMVLLAAIIEDEKKETE